MSGKVTIHLPKECQMLVLLIDDDNEDYEILCEALHNVDASAECLQAFDGEEGLELLNRRRDTDLPDYIFMDVNMPVMGGQECLQKLKAEKKFKDIPVIIYTTTSNPRELNSFLRSGAQAFVTKPSSFHALVTTLREVLTDI